MTPGQPPLTPLQATDSERAASAERLKAARKSMITSAVFSALLLAYLAWRISINYTNPALRGNNSILLIICCIVLARLGFSGYRLYNRWKALKAAQDHHRSLG